MLWSDSFNGLTPLTEKITKEMLSEFQGYVRDHAKPCGECRKAFLGGK